MTNSAPALIGVLWFAAAVGGCSRDSGLNNCVADACGSNSSDLAPAGDGLFNEESRSDLAGVDFAALCSAKEGPLHLYYNDAEAVALVARRWARCSGIPIGTSDTFGLEFTADHRWFALMRDGAGNIERVPRGFDSQGTYVTVNTPPFLGLAQFNLGFATGGGIPYAVSFEDAPPRMQMRNELGRRIYVGF